MKTQVSSKNERRNFEVLSEQEMNLIKGGDSKRPKKDKDVFDPDEQ